MCRLIIRADLDARNIKGATPAIQFRYADVLLNYAEALAETERGGECAARLLMILHPLRERAGMPPDIDFDREYNHFCGVSVSEIWINISKLYAANAGWKKHWKVRRVFDIMRWAAAEELIIGNRAHGALFIGSNLAGTRYGARVEI